MKLIKDIIGQFAFDADISLVLQYYVVDGCSGYFQNIKGITSFNDEEIILTSSCGDVKVCGEKLFIRKYADGDMIIDGKISSVEKV